MYILSLKFTLLLILFAACSSEYISTDAREDKGNQGKINSSVIMPKPTITQMYRLEPTVTPKPTLLPKQTPTITGTVFNLRELKSGIQEIYINQTIDEVTIDRKVIIHAPPNLVSEKKYSVVMAFHGNGGIPDKWINTLNRFVGNNDFIGVYPEGYLKSWNLGKEKSKADDVYFINKLMKELNLYKQLDSKNIFALGSSNGAGMVQELAVQTNHFKAIGAIVTQLIKGKEPKFGSPKVSVLQILGMQDPIIPYEGGLSRVGHEFYGGEESAFIWAAHNQCDLHTLAEITTEGNRKIIFRDCESGKTVLHYGISEAKHGIPGGTEGGLFDLIWDFFKMHE